MLLISFVVLSVLAVVSAANTVICDRKTTAITTKNTAVFSTSTLLQEFSTSDTTVFKISV